MSFAPRMEHLHLCVLDQPGLRLVFMHTLPYLVVIQVTLVLIDTISSQMQQVAKKKHGHVIKPTQLIHLHIHFLAFTNQELAKL
jgi:UDP-N-acetylmuramyl pentapeptide phosphotransferase/UDP-N-acetylglucosamine-1-phosphate transferase